MYLLAVSLHVYVCLFVCFHWSIVDLWYEFNLCVGKIPWRRSWQPTPVFLPGESPMDKAASWVIVHRVAKSRTSLKQLNMHAHIISQILLHYGLITRYWIYFSVLYSKSLFLIYLRKILIPDVEYCHGKNRRIWLFLQD